MIPSPCLGPHLQISASLPSGLTLGCCLPVVHLLYSSFLNLGRDLQKKFLQAIPLYGFFIGFSFIQITICLLPILTHFLPIQQVCPFSGSFVVLGCFVRGHDDNQVSQIRVHHDTISQGALFCSGDVLYYIVLHVARS